MPALNRVNVERVRQLLAKGCTRKQVAIRLGVSLPVISDIATGKRVAK